MARNSERDAREAQRRKNQILEAGFELFSTQSIEMVSMQAVADAADVGVATLYKYYQTKIKLVTAISAKMWFDYWEEFTKNHNMVEVMKMNAYDLIDLCGEEIIHLYQNRPEMLAFSSNYKNFIHGEEETGKDYLKQLAVLGPVKLLFHQKFEQAKKDGSIRTDIPEMEIITTCTHTMIGMAERYVQGFVWGNPEKNDYTRELLHVKEMILIWVAGPKKAKVN